ncbi:hypothetical protein O181_027937 [Austropuccinia psidii MF-1]|uniref:Uncharacterized protein n=1 Tax=Austropuccinia psidii MF-1 TaxID=1389203 RepID=A0A9Q3CTL1_9BASI|nr:hypothetical protein [Austropuccinia psidii MF-1]
MLTTLQRKRKKSMPLNKSQRKNTQQTMGDAISEPSDDDKDPKEEFLVEYQEQTHLEIQDMQLEARMPQDTANKNLCKHTQDAQTFLVTPTRGVRCRYETLSKKSSTFPVLKICIR